MPTAFAATLTPQPSNSPIGASTPIEQYDRACEASAQAHATWLQYRTTEAFDAWMQAVNAAHAWWEHVKTAGQLAGLETQTDETEAGEETHES